MIDTRSTIVCMSTYSTFQRKEVSPKACLIVVNEPTFKCWDPLMVSVVVSQCVSLPLSSVNSVPWEDLSMWRVSQNDRGHVGG
jgi:hypothetical protein